MSLRWNVVRTGPGESFDSEMQSSGQNGTTLPSCPWHVSVSLSGPRVRVKGGPYSIWKNLVHLPQIYRILVAMACVAKYQVVDGQINSEIRDGVRKYYDSDALGSTIALYDVSQAKTDFFTYWPFGEVRTQAGSTPTKYKHNGTYGCREQTNYGVYIRVRVLLTKDGRWITVDPLWPNESAFAYVRNNPSSRMDFAGMQSGDSMKDWGNKFFPPGFGIPPWLVPEPLNPLPPCNVPQPWPYYGQWNRGFWGFWSYGNCCGPQKDKACGSASAVIDCVDAACRAHDICVGDEYIIGAVKWLPCNKKFCNDIQWCWNQNCTKLPLDLKQCAAIKDIANNFCNLFGGGPPGLLRPWR